MGIRTLYRRLVQMFLKRRMLFVITGLPVDIKCFASANIDGRVESIDDIKILRTHLRFETVEEAFEYAKEICFAELRMDLKVCYASDFSPNKVCVKRVCDGEILTPAEKLEILMMEPCLT